MSSSNQRINKCGRHMSDGSIKEVSEEEDDNSASNKLS
jgi:hypothetical protein